MNEKQAMSAYLVERTEEWDYDEYSGFVVVAANPADALAVVAEKFAPTTLPNGKVTDYRSRDREQFANAQVTEIDLTVRGEVLGSFHAG